MDAWIVKNTIPYALRSPILDILRPLEVEMLCKSFRV